MKTKFGLVFVVSLVFVFLNLQFGFAQSYSAIDMGTLGGATSHTHNINSKGDVVGFSMTGNGNETHAFLYSYDAKAESGQMTDLGKLSGSINSYAYGINDNKEVVGACFVGTGIEHAFLYSEGAMVNLNTILGGTSSRAIAINNKGQVLGSCDSDGFLYEKGIITDLGDSAGHQVFDINNNGQIVGRYWFDVLEEDDPDNEDHTLYGHATVYENGVLTDIGTLGENYLHSIAYSINDNGQIVGASWTDDLPGVGVITHAFLYSEGTMTDLGVLGGDPTNPNGYYSYAMDINDNGLIVGYSSTNYGISHGFVWDSVNGMRDLNDITGKSADWVIDSAEAINNSGQIADAMGLDGTAHGFFLDVVPEPSSFALLFTAIAAISVYALRRYRM